MKITLTPYEKREVLRKAAEYTEKTGDNYSMQFISMLIADKMTKTLEAVVDEVFQEKVRMHEEELARDQR